MRILTTRPALDAEEFAVSLSADAHTVISSPMLSIQFLPCPMVNEPKLQALVITSANALRALQHDKKIRYLPEVPVFAVGPASAQLARTMGFSPVIEGTAGGKELTEIIADKAQPDGGRLLHLSGDLRAVKIDAELVRRGFDVQTSVVYRAVPANAFSPHARNALADTALDAVILMSPRTAQIFASLAIEAQLRDQAQLLHYACISQATARALAPLDLSPRQIHVPDRPTTPDLLALVNRISPQSNY